MATSRDTKKYRNKNPWMKFLFYARRRCYDKKHPAFKFYGAKGIQCFLSPAEIKFIWERDKATQLESPSLDRIDSKQNYTFNNCRFIELIANMSRPRLISLVKHDTSR